MSKCNLLEKYDIHGWKPDDSLSVDDNMMDLVMLVTRNSQLKQGSMACVLVDEESDDNTILSVATNLPLFKESESDVHAEIAALGSASRVGKRTENATAYITMPPCKRCFAALTVSGIKRIVTRRTPPIAILDCAMKQKVEFVSLSRESMEQQTKRINLLIHGHPDGKKRSRAEVDSSGENKKFKNEKLSA